MTEFRSPTPNPRELESIITRIGTAAKPSDPKESYLRNCWVRSRPGEDDAVMAGPKTQTIILHLDGYAIIPLEEYVDLLQQGER